MFRTAFFYTKDDEMAREVVLDVFASIWNRRQTLIIPKDFGAYCFIAVKNMALNLIKKNLLSAHEELPQNMMADGSNPEQQIIDEEIFEHYEKVLYELPDRCRRVFVMAKEDGMVWWKSAARAANNFCRFAKLQNCKSESPDGGSLFSWAGMLFL